MKSLRRRYFFLLWSVGPNYRALSDTFEKLFGRGELVRAGLRPIIKGTRWSVVRVWHSDMAQLRVAIATLEGPKAAYTLVASGTVRGLNRALKRRRAGQDFVKEFEELYLRGRRAEFRRRKQRTRTKG